MIPFLSTATTYRLASACIPNSSSPLISVAISTPRHVLKQSASIVILFCWQGGITPGPCLIIQISGFHLLEDTLVFIEIISCRDSGTSFCSFKYPVTRYLF
ncbi:hypothetical protein ABKN59_011374 [Abortiporus biennis]